MGICGGLWMAAGIYTYWDYKTHPELYAQMSAPWYTPILLSGIASGAVILAALMVKVMIRKKVMKEEGRMTVSQIMEKMISFFQGNMGR